MAGGRRCSFRRAPPQWRPDYKVMKSLAGAFRLKIITDSGEFAAMTELSEREGVACSYMACIQRLTLLAPDIVEALLAEKHGPR